MKNKKRKKKKEKEKERKRKKKKEKKKDRKKEMSCGRENRVNKGEDMVENSARCCGEGCVCVCVRKNMTYLLLNKRYFLKKKK